MPTIFFYDPDLDDSKKKELIRDFMEMASRLIGFSVLL
jgi:lysylphosphatidylglycerol synthetase-like protein (DUF2156 family)